MPTKISINDFVMQSTRYARNAAQKANVNGNKYLSMDEAKALPKDLQDNLEDFRGFRKSLKKSALVEPNVFADYHARQVRTAAEAVDANDDGFVTATEAKKMAPLQKDNFDGFARAVAAGVYKNDEKALVKDVRKALSDYIRNVMFNPRADDGHYFQRDILGDSLNSAFAKSLKAEFLADARAWTPQKDSEGQPWELSDFQGATLVSGRFGGFHTEIIMREGGKPHVYVEID